MKRIFIVFFILFTSLLANESKDYNYKRVASLTLSGDEMILSLIESNRIVGLCGAINEEKDMSNVWEKAGKYPKIESNIEVLAELEPDFVIAADWMKKEVIAQIEELGAKLFIYKTPKNFEEQKKLILELSNYLEVPDKGKIIVKNMDNRLKKLQTQISKVKTHTSKIMIYTSFESTSGKNTTFDSMVELIGGENIAKTAGIIGSEQISKEKVIELNPEIIIIPLWNNHINSEEFIEFVKNDESFKEVRAVKENKVYVLLHKKLAPTSQYMIDGIEELGRKIYNLESEKL